MSKKKQIKKVKGFLVRMGNGKVTRISIIADKKGLEKLVWKHVEIKEIK